MQRIRLWLSKDKPTKANRHLWQTVSWTRSERKALRQEQARERSELRASRSDAEQIARLDAAGHAARKERKRLGTAKLVN